MQLDLPHCQEFKDCNAQECVDDLIHDVSSEIYLAISDDFYDAEDQLRIDDIYPHYRKYYDVCATRLSGRLGPPIFAGGYLDSGYPEWAIGEHLHLWQYNNCQMWLRLHHEDRECPILIVFARSIA